MMKYYSGKNVNLRAFIHPISGIGSLLIIVAVIFATLVITPPVRASGLDDFETAATTDNSEEESEEEKREKEKKKEKENHDQERQGDFFSNFFGNLIGKIFEEMVKLVFETVAAEANMSFARVDSSTVEGSIGGAVEIRETGEPTLPFIQLDGKYMYINPEITAVDACFEVGYGALGFECRNTYFVEINPSDNLNLTQFHLLLRFSRTRSLEYGIGFGRIYLDGNEQNSGSSVTYPIKIYLNDSLGVKFKPTHNWINGNYIQDYDLAMVLSQRFGSLELGYRVLEVNGKNLNGGYVGFVLHY